MKLVDLKCPNCNSTLEQEGESLVCPSCGAVFAIDYDDSDVEHERIKSEAELEEKRLEHEKNMLEREYELREQARINDENRRLGIEKKRVSKKTVCIIAIVILCCCGLTSYHMTRELYMGHVNSGSSRDQNRGTPTVTPTPTPRPTPTPSPNYNVTALDVAGQIDDFIESGKIIEMNEKECCEWTDGTKLCVYTQTSVEVENAFIVTNIPDKSPSQSNRLVVFYKITWNNDTKGDKICYDAVYFEGLRVNPNGGGAISNFTGKTIYRSEAGWGWPLATCFEDYKQCYRENVTALGGTVEEITTDGPEETDGDAESIEND